jgi:hypothetical protein
VCFSRFSQQRSLIGTDYRFGFPLTWAWGCWSGKIGYEHTSSHLGDGFIETTGAQRVASIRDEVTVGLAYRFWDQFRLYGQMGYAGYVNTPTGNNRPDRWDMGVEWCKFQATGWRGHPFAALDLEFRGDENYHGNFTGQIGWQWRALDNGRSVRLVLEYYDGQSPYGEFLTTKEHWYGCGVVLDF